MPKVKGKSKLLATKIPPFCAKDSDKERHNKTKTKWRVARRQNISVKDIYYPMLKEFKDNIEILINYIDKKCTYLESMGLDKYRFLRDVECRLDILQEDINNHEFIVLPKLSWFIERLFEIYVNINPFIHKTIVMPKPISKFRPLSLVVSTKAEFDASVENSQNYISNIVVISSGIVTYSPDCMTLCCATADGSYHVAHCASPVTDMVRIGKNSVMATIPFREKILFISPSSYEMKTFHCGFSKISYVDNCKFVGLKLFDKTIYLVDWSDSTVESKFTLKDEPTNIAMGPQLRLLVTFSNINRISCYNLNGRQLFKLYCHSIDIPTDITVYHNDFYVLQGSIIYRISSVGGVSKREIGIKARYVSLGRHTILVSDYLGIPHIIRTNKDFWPRVTYFHQVQTPILNNQMFIDDPYDIKDILPMSRYSTLVIYRSLKAVLFTDNGKEISKTAFTFHFQPTALCRLNSSTFLILFSKNRKIQYISYSVDCPVLKEGHIIDVNADYIQMCHIVSNKFLALTTCENKEVHILSIENYNTVIENKISLEHCDVTIAATPISFVVADKRENKLVFYSSFGEVLFEKYLDFSCNPYHIYSDNLYFYLFCNRKYIVICYDISGEVKWQLQLPWVIHSRIAVFQGTVSVVDVKLSRVLFYKYHEWSSCHLDLVNPYIRHLNIRNKENMNNKILLADMCQLPNGQLVVSDINNASLLYISNEGRIVSTLTLPSVATDICRWNSSQMGITLPLEKELWVIGNLSNRVRMISLSNPYVWVRKFGNGQILCFCDKPYHLDIVSIQKHNQGEIISTTNIPFAIKSLSIENETLNVLIVAKKKVFVCNTSPKIGSTLLHPNIKLQRYLYGGCIDKTSVCLIDESRLFTLNHHNLEVRDPVTRNQLNLLFDLVDIFSRNICGSEMLSSILYLQDLTVSDKSRECLVPLCLGDKEPVDIHCSVITDNNLIAVYDRNNKNIKILTFDGKLLDSIKLNVVARRMCRWWSNTLVITTNTNQLFTLKVEFPLSFSTHQIENKYSCIASLSDNLLVCSIRSGNNQPKEGTQQLTKVRMSRFNFDDESNMPAIQIVELHLTVRVIKEIDLTVNEVKRGICDIAVTANDVIVVYADGYALLSKFVIFLNRNGERLHLFTPFMDILPTCMTIDDTYVYISLQSKNDKYIRIVSLSQTGEYKKIFLNSEICKRPFNFKSINCKGPKFVGFDKEYLYVEGLLKLNRERFQVRQLVTDLCYVQVKDIDISVDGQTVVSEKANTGNVKLFQRNGMLLCHTNLGTSVGGVCFSEESYIMVTVPDIQEIFQLNQEDLKKNKVWQSPVPYGVIWRKLKNTYCCAHTNLTEYHTIQIDDNQLKVLECTSLFKFASILHFPSIRDITAQKTNGKFSNERNKNLKYNQPEGASGKIEVRRGNYKASSMLGNDQISVRKLPHRTAMFPISISVFGNRNYGCDFGIYKNINLIMLQDNIAVLLYQYTLMVATTEGHILHQRKFQRMPRDICRWTDKCFIVVFDEDKQLVFFKTDLTLLKTINTKKQYSMIYKRSNSRLVCAFEGDPNRHYRPNLPSSCVDVLHIHNKTYEYSCQMEFGMETVRAIGVTSSEDIVVIKESKSKEALCWYRDGLIRLFDIPLSIYPRRIAVHGEKVYITEREKDIIQVSLDSVIETFISIADIEVSLVYDIHVSDNSLILLGNLDNNSCGFFHYEI